MSSNNYDDGKTIIEGLIKTGLSKSSAKVLVYIALNQGTTSENIERDMSLRQPDVSVSVQDLYGRGWLSRVSVKRIGKGRPKYIYNLSKPFRDIVDEIEKSELEKINGIEDNIRELKGSSLFSKF